MYNTMEKSLLSVTSGNPDFRALRKKKSRYEMTAED
jgi:hypothetical protein